MALFHELKNKYVLLTIDVINKLYKQKVISSIDFEDVFLENIDSTYLEDILKYPVFEQIPEKMQFKLCVDAPVPIRFTKAEKIWLKGILEDLRIRLFLSSEEQQQLLSHIQDVPDYSQYISSKSLAEHPDELKEEQIQKIQKILEAITQKRLLSFVNHTPSGAYKNENMIPYRLEYSITEEVFRVSLWKERPIKANLKRMSDITLGDIVPESEFQTVQDIVQKRKSPEPIVLRIQNEKQAIERAGMLFSNCNRTVIPIYDETGTTLVAHEMQLEYYLFDETDLLKKILSFGPTIQVLGNEHVLDRIKSILADV